MHVVVLAIKAAAAINSLADVKKLVKFRKKLNKKFIPREYRFPIRKKKYLAFLENGASSVWFTSMPKKVKYFKLNSRTFI